MINKTLGNIFKGDKVIWMVFFFLCLISVIEVYSASAQLTYRASSYIAPMFKHIGLLALGVLATVLTLNVKCRYFKLLTTPLLGLSFVMLICVFFVGDSTNGAQRWMGIGGIQFQPSEVAKIAVILFMAMIIDKIPKQFDKFLSLVKVLAMLIPLIIVVAISNLSTAVIIIGISVCMLFVASPKYLQFIIVAVAVVVFAVAFVMLAGYRSTRIEAWLHPETAGTDAVFQTMMGLYAIGSGGLFGKGLGESLQKLGNVPESQNDMIFTIICEELGLFGAICLILLFILLIWRMMVIANNARDLYGSLLVIGVMSHIAIQVILNIAVVTNSLPNTGVILPFISYGGTSIIFLMAEIGLVLSVSRGIRLENV